MWATPQDVAARWRPLTSAEMESASVLIEDAEDIIASRWPDIQARIDSGDLTAQSLKRVVAGMVRRSMIAGSADGISAQSQSAGPFSVSNTFSNPNGNLYLSKDDIALLGGSQSRRAFAVDLGPSSLPPGYWS